MHDPKVIIYLQPMVRIHIVNYGAENYVLKIDKCMLKPFQMASEFKHTSKLSHVSTKQVLTLTKQSNKWL